MRELKWYIFNDSNEPLCWEYIKWDSARAIEFDCAEDADDFIILMQTYYPDFKEPMIPQETILFYDGGYVSAEEVIGLMIEEIENNLREKQNV